MASVDQPRLTVRSPADLISAVPYLLGFHPADSIVLVAMRERRLIFVARADLPGPGVRPADLAGQLTTVIMRQGADSAAVIGYGPPERVTPVVDAVRASLARSGLRILDALRVGDQRYWSYLCLEPECCPPEGTRYDPTSSPVAAAAVFAGEVALPDRAALAAQIAPVDGAARTAMRQATDRAERRFAGLVRSAPPADLLGQETVRTVGETAVEELLERYASGGRPTDDEVAWLGLLLMHLPVRDHAWERTDGTDRHLDLWTDVLRRVEPRYAAAPAALLAFAAWRAGRGALAVVALDRAFAAQPGYSMALLLDEMLRNGLPPSTFDGWPERGSVVA